MKNETIEALAAFVEAQRTTDLKAISTMIELVKLFPAGPAREPALEALQALVQESEKVHQIAERLFSVLGGEVNATRS